MERKKSILLRILLLIGLVIFFYPNISDYVNRFTQTRGIVGYTKGVNEFSQLDVDKIFDQAQAYNQDLFQRGQFLGDPGDLKAYEKNLNPFGNGMIGSLTIEKIGVNLPIYHGVNEGVIQVGIGHLPGSSLPIGGPSSHAVLSTHNGLASARLFTDLPKLDYGDEFILSILGKNLSYKVDHIAKVLPKDLDLLRIEQGKDYVTLFTCTPYGINTHRLLVRGVRVYKDEGHLQDQVQREMTHELVLTGLKLGLILVLILGILGLIIKDLLPIKKAEYENTERTYHEAKDFQGQKK